VDVERSERNGRAGEQESGRAAPQDATERDEDRCADEQRHQELEVPDVEHDTVHARCKVVEPDERKDEQPGLLRDRRLVHERPRAEREPVRQGDVERFVSEVDAVPEPPVRDADDGERDHAGEHLRRVEAPQRCVQPAAPTREGAP